MDKGCKRIDLGDLHGQFMRERHLRRPRHDEMCLNLQGPQRLERAHTQDDA